MTGDLVTAYVGLGSNLDRPVRQLHEALKRLASLPGTTLQAVSGFYGNPPMGPPDQPDYVNAVARLATTLEPRALLRECQDVERRQGRVRGADRWGPRTIDLDLLVYGDAIVDEPGLRVPHPGIAERAFVLLPLAELDRDLDVPGVGRVASLLDGVDTSGLVRLPEERAGARGQAARDRV